MFQHRGNNKKENMNETAKLAKTFQLLADDLTLITATLDLNGIGIHRATTSTLYYSSDEVQIEVDTIHGMSCKVFCRTYPQNHDISDAGTWRPVCENRELSAEDFLHLLEMQAIITNRLEE